MSTPGRLKGGPPAQLASVDLERLARLRQCAVVDPHHLLSGREVRAAQASRDGSLLVMHVARSAGELYLEPVDGYAIAVIHDARQAVDTWTPSGGFATGRMEQGEAVTIPVGEPAYINFRDSNSATVLFVRPPLLVRGLGDDEAGAGGPRMVARTGARDPLLRCLAYAMANEAAGRAATRGSMINRAGPAIAAHLLANYRDHSNASSGPLSQAHQALVIDYISARLHRDVRLDELAALTGFSTSHFAHLFRSTLGEPPMRYVLRMKMQRARELIETSSMSIAEVGASVGCADPAHFSRTFRAHWKTAPSSLRRPRL